MPTFSIVSSFNPDLLGRQIENQIEGKFKFVSIPYSQYILPDHQGGESEVIFAFELLDHWILKALATGTKDVTSYLAHQISCFYQYLLTISEQSQYKIILVESKFTYLTSHLVNFDAAGIERKLAKLDEVSVYARCSFDKIVNAKGYENIFSTKYWQMAQSPFSEYGLQAIAREIRSILAIEMKNHIRMVVVDLDDTLWSGVLAEVGVAGIVSGGGYPGSAHYLIQMVLLAAKQKGIVLAVCSKNSISLVEEAFDKRKDLGLRKKDFIAVKANYEPKSKNMNALLQETNLRPDSVLFIDDNYLEREEIKRLFPTMNVVDLSDDKSKWWIEISDCLSLPYMAIEKRDKTQDYQVKLSIDQRLRSSVDRKGFLKELAIKVTMTPLNSINQSRCQELIQKSNQYNFTQERIDLNHFPNNLSILAVGMSDAFGSEEIIGVCMLTNSDNKIFVKNLVLSCRVLGRGVEEYLFWYLADQHSMKQDEILVAYEKKLNNQQGLAFLEKFGRLTKSKGVVCIPISALLDIKPSWINEVA